MNPQTILRLDRFIGTPACAALSLWVKLTRSLRKKISGPPGRIVFVKLIEMGSTVLACPAFKEATRLVGKENMFFLCFKANRSIVDILPYFKEQNIITIDDSNLLSFASGLMAARARMRKENIDTAIDMEGLTRSSAIITYLTGCRRRVGYCNFTSEGPYRGRLFTHELNYNFQHHTSRMFWALTRASAVSDLDVPLLKLPLADVDISLPEFSPGSDEKDVVRDIVVRRIGAFPGRLALINANCSDLLPLRRWPTENFIELSKRLLDRFPDLGIAVTGAPDEREGAEKIAEAIGFGGRAGSVAGHTTLRQLLTLYSMSDVLISNDSGPCHFASLTPIRIVSLFGPETPVLYSPLGPNNTSISAGLACSPCVNILNHRFSPCTDNQCMKRISVNMVFDTVLKVLDGKGRS